MCHALIMKKVPLREGKLEGTRYTCQGLEPAFSWSTSRHEHMSQEGINWLATERSYVQLWLLKKF